ncbi:MAG: winged helix-turn-helix transcriptional regulator [Mycobacterium sp.]
MPARNYNQNCPIARGLDVLGERWTLLILRELLGGPRRYGDLRAALPGIATNLLADRLRDLEDTGLVDRTELPPPIARTVYTLSETGWRKVPPVLRAVASFGLDLLEPTDSAVTPLNGFLAGILLALDPARAADLAGAVTTSYRVEIDGRRFEFAVTGDGLTAPHGPPAVTVTATAADLIAARFGATPAERKAALRRWTFDGHHDAVTAMRAAFQCLADPRLPLAPAPA